MKRLLGLFICMVLLLANVQTAVACWVALTVEEMEEMAGLIVVGQLTGDTREVRLDGGAGRTIWAVRVEQVLKGEAGELVEVATGGLISASPAVQLSTDYRLDSYGELFLLYLGAADEDGSRSPLTPYAIVPLGRAEGGERLGAYEIVSDMHDADAQAEILAWRDGSVRPTLTSARLASGIGAEDDSTPNSENGDKGSALPAIAVGGLLAAVGLMVVKRRTGSGN